MANPFEELFRKLSAIEEGQKELRTLLANQSNTYPGQSANVAPVLSSKQVQEMTGWPNGTFYAKVAEMPEGVVIRKSKRLLFDREKFMVWLQTPTRP